MQLSTDVMGEITNNLMCGVVIMDEDWKIHYINELACTLTGWKVRESVPYNEYCQKGEISKNEHQCILSAGNHIPFFNSHKAIYSGKKEEIEMLLEEIIINRKRYQMLLIRYPNESEEKKTKFHELLVQETMLAQEAERKKIARELHDHIGQNVYSIFLGLEAIEPFVNEEIYEKYFTNMLNMMEKTVNDIKRLTKNLRPEMVFHLGIKEALQEAVDDWERLYKISIKLVTNIIEEERFDREKELHLFRVIQEAVHNAVRHGKPTRITINLHLVDQSLFFKVIDNGKGFQLESKTKHGLGMKHMYERCRMMEGVIKWIRSKCDNFTVVEGFVFNFKNEGEVCSELINC